MMAHVPRQAERTSTPIDGEEGAGERPPGGLLARLTVALPLGAAGQDAAAGVRSLPVARAAGCVPYASEYGETKPSPFRSRLLSFGRPG